MSRLENLQRELQASVIDGEGVIADFIDASVEIPATIRLQIYSDAYRLRLIEALQANYPLLAQLVGEHAFARLTQLYLAVQPSRHYSIRWFGHRLVDFLREHPDYRKQPWLAELAMWEWAIATAFDAADAATLTVENLTSIAPNAWSDMRFVFHPSVQRVALTTNVVAIAKAAADNLSLPRPSTQERTEWLIWRQDLTVQYRSLDAHEAAVIDGAIAGGTFSDLCELLVARDAIEDQVPLIAAGLLKQWVNDRCLGDSSHHR
jgi:hypothetical protein